MTILKLSKPQIPDWLEIVAQRWALIPKPEYHLTVASFWLDQELPGIPDLARDIQFVVEPLPRYWMAGKDYRSSPHVIQLHRRRSVIQEVRCDQLPELYARISERVQRVVEPPEFLHVTLFVGSDQRIPGTRWEDGIGIRTKEDEGLNLLLLEYKE